jgi:hypothetical protein
MEDTAISFTYDHRALKTRLPVRSALFKQRTGGLVVRWVTTSEYPLLYVIYSFLQFFSCWWSAGVVVERASSCFCGWGATPGRTRG